jgi:D-lactate dehydrogenase
MKIGFFDVKDEEKDFFSSKLAGQELFFSADPLKKADLESAKDFDVISVFIGSLLDREILTGLPNLKFIATRTTGYDHIDVKAAAEKNIPVSFVPSYGDHTVAEFTFALLLDLTRKIRQCSERVRAGEFATEGLQGTELFGKTLGVVGTGRIGSNVARIARALDMKVIAYDVFPNKELAEKIGFEYVTFEGLLANSDAISLHVPYLPSTHHLINKENIGLIKKGAILLNTARGGVVETEALITALKQGIISGAGLDVLEEESATKNEDDLMLYNRLNDAEMKIVLQNHLLMEMGNVIVTPHNAFNTKEAVRRIMETTAENISAFIAGKPINLVK